MPSSLREYVMRERRRHEGMPPYAADGRAAEQCSASPRRAGCHHPAADLRQLVMASRAKRVEESFPVPTGHCEERSDAAIRSFRRGNTDCHANAAALARNDRGREAETRGLSRAPAPTRRTDGLPINDRRHRCSNRRSMIGNIVIQLVPV